MRHTDTAPFIAAITEILASIPPGYVVTYGDLAAWAGHPSHARLAGHVLAGFGPASPLPCHRVVNAKGRTAPHWHAQRTLLTAEGVTFRPDGCVDMNRHHWIPLPC